MVPVTGKRRLLAIAALLASPYAIAQLPLDYFILHDAVRDMRVSPDGEYVALVTVDPASGNSSVALFESGEMDEAVFRSSLSGWSILSLEWAEAGTAVVTLGSTTRDEPSSGIALLRVDDLTMTIVDLDDAQLAAVAPGSPGRIVVSSPGVTTPDGLPPAFEPRKYFNLSLSDGQRLLIDDLPVGSSAEFDANGDAWLLRFIDDQRNEYVWLVRTDETWAELRRVDTTAVPDLTVHGFDPQDDGFVIVSSRNGSDKEGIWTMDVATGNFAELIFRREDVDAAGVRFHRNNWTRPDEITAVRYFTDRHRYEYFDELEGALYLRMEDIVRHSHHLEITSSSRDGDSLTVYNRGPKDPGSYYLLKDRVLHRIASARPDAAVDLAPVLLADYESRDRQLVFAHMTQPRGNGPWPLVVLPRLAPFGTERIDFDAWAQLLANEGYLVMQPQIRGAWGYGREHVMAAVAGGGQGGFAMLEDIADGIDLLVAQEMADSKRVAVFGWGFGGYTALAAASRISQQLSCVAAAAAVPDTMAYEPVITNPRFGLSARQQRQFWRDSFNPIEAADTSGVPVLLLHGVQDDVVQLFDVYRYKKMLDDAGVSNRLVELEGTGRNSDDLTLAARRKLFAELLEFLRDECFVAETS